MRARILSLGLVALWAAALPLPLSAQDDSAPEASSPDPLAGIEAISTTITRRPMDVQDVAASVTVFDVEMIRSLDLDDTEDIAFLIPNAVTKSGGFGSLTIRGLGTGLTSQSAVALHTDGIFSGPNSFFDAEGIDIVRGPSGSLYGRNATGGAINLRSRKPTDQYEVFGEIDLANYDQVRVRAGVNVPLLGEGNDTLAFRGTFGLDRHDGWIDNEFEVRSRDPGNSDQLAFNGALRWVPSEDFDVWLRGGYAKLRDDVTPSRPLIDRYPVGALPTGNTTLPPGFGTLRSDPYTGFTGLLADLRSGLIATVGVPLITAIAGLNGLTFDQQIQQFLQQGGAPFIPALPAVLPLIFRDQSVIGQAALPLPSDPSSARLSAGRLGEPEIRRWTVNGEANWRLRDLPLLGDVQASLKGGVFDTTANVFIDLDGTELGVLDIQRDNGFLRWTGEFQLVSENEGPFNWVAGLFFFEEREEFSQLVVTPFSLLTEETRGRERGIAPFFHFFWDVHEDWTLDAGVRWSKDIVETAVTRPPAGIARPVGYTYDHREVWRERTGDVSLTWRWAEDRSLYVKWARGYRPGGVNFGDAVADPDPSVPLDERIRLQSFAPEQVDAWEVGSRNRFLDGLLLVNLTAFLYDYENVQVPTVTVGGLATTNAGTADIRGVELELQVPLPILDGGIVAANVGYLHAEYGSFCSDDAFQFLAVSDPGCPAATTPYDGQSDIDGKRLPDTPRWSASLFVVLNRDLGEWGKLRFMVKSSFRDTYFRRHFNVSEIDRIDEWTRTDVRFIWSSPSERWSLHVYAENLEGDFVYANTLVGPEITGGLPVGLSIPFSPRIYGVQLEFRFGG